MSNLTNNTLPASWPMVPLGSICEVGAGNGAPQGDTYFIQGTHPFVRMQDVGRCSTPYITTTVDQLNDLALKKHSLRLWPQNSLLIPKSGASVALNKRALLSKPAYVVSHLAVLVPGPLIDPEYLYYLSCTLDMMRLALDPAYPSLRTSDLARLRIPLPPLSEQHRIVEILQEAEAIRRLRSEAEATTTEVIPAIYAQMFLAPKDRSKWKETNIGDLAANHSNSIRTGPFGSDLLHSEFVDCGTAVLGIDNVASNRFRWEERRYITQAKFDDLQRFRVYPGDVMVTIMGTVGRVAIAPPDLPEAISTKHLCVITPDRTKTLPIFIWATLLHNPAVRAQTKAVGKGAIMEGWNSTIIRKLRLLLPPLKLQEQFEELVTEALSLESFESKSREADALIVSLSTHVFSGQLTADWRDLHARRLDLEARERDAALKQAGATFAQSRRATIQVMESIFEQRTDGIYSDLNREQRDLLFRIQQRVGGVAYARYFSAQSLSPTLEGSLRRNPQAIEGHLAVFAARGLIIPLSREEQTEDTGEFVFGNAYRLPIKDRETNLGVEEGNQIDNETGRGIIVDKVLGDHSRGRELERLVAQIEKESALQ